MIRIDSIDIRYVKGIEHKALNLPIAPNKPNLLVAPNGFGKSSFATAFSYLRGNKIRLKECDYYCGDSNKQPQVSLTYTDEDDNRSCTLIADSNKNEIKERIANFVINCRMEAKGKRRYMGGISAAIEIPDIILVGNIPPRTSFSYSFSSRKEIWGANSKVLPNIKTSIINNQRIVSGLKVLYMELECANGIRIQKAIKAFIEKLNQKQGNKSTLLRWIADEELKTLSSIQHLQKIGNYLHSMCNTRLGEAECYLAAIELVWLFNYNKKAFKDACKYNDYLLQKESFQELLSSLNTTWQEIRASESNNQLVVKFPDANLISNGQRDILTFVSMLCKAKASLDKGINILVIDEVFDYLDDANLIAAQYYITKFIEDFKRENNGRVLFPLILTHLNPLYFKNYSFNKMKIHFLERSSMKVEPALEKLLRNREKPCIKDDVDKYLLHFHPELINRRQDFQRIGLKEKWGEGDHFKTFIKGEVDKYIAGDPYDPIAVCCAVRNKIEESVYQMLDSEESKEKFLETHRTRLKLDFARSKGCEIPEICYLLGIIYNEAMHWNDNVDHISPIAAKLEHKVIKQMIGILFYP